jgi:ABC-type phosphate transport system substrate-binding protein
MYMKTVNLFLAAALAGAAVINPAKADGGDENRQVIYIESAKYTLPLVEKWIAEYNKTNPGVQVRHAGKDVRTADLRIVANAEADNSGEEGKVITYVGRSALLPVTAKDNPLHEQISKRRFGKKELKKLFFSEDLFEEESDKKDPLQEQLTVYSGNSAASAAPLFASHFGQTIAGFRGKKILGDDIYLLQAISKDPTGVTFNNLSYIYDLKDRQLKDEIALLPLNVKKEQSEIIRSENLDETLSLLENEKVELVPVHHIGFAYDAQSGAKDFLKWILSEGQKFNHEFGFLQLDEKTLSYQKKHFGGNLLTTK